MSYLDAIILGILQGLTEFLPVSSSGHLVLTQAVLNVKQPGVSFEIVLHLGTLLAVLIYFRKRVWSLVAAVFDRRMTRERSIIGCLIVGTIPAGLVGVLFEDFFERAFSSPLTTAVMLFVTGSILLSTRWARKGKATVKWKSALVMGVGQAMAIMPGISRSGSTIALGMHASVNPSEAAEFSFLLAIPAIGGAAVLKIRDLLSLDAALYGQYLVGSLTAFVLALLAVYLVLETIRRGKFEYFAYYCFAMGALGLYLFL